MRKVIGFSAVQAIMVFAVAAAGVLMGRLLAPAPLGTFWPETAMLLVLFLRTPSFVHPLGWASAWFGMFAAGLLFDPNMLNLGSVALINLVGVCVAWLVLYTWENAAPRVGTLRGLARLVGAAALGAMATAVLSALLERALYGGHVAGHFALMWSSQLIGYLLLAPALLSLPKRGGGKAMRMRRSDFHPIVALTIAFVVALAVGKAGVFLLPMLVLLWAGLVYAPSVMTWTSFVVGFLTLSLMPEDTPLGLWYEFAFQTAFALWLILPIGIAILRRQGALRWPLLQRRGLPEGGALAARAAFRQEAQRLLDANSYPLALLRVEVQMQNPGAEMQLLQRFTRALRKKDVVGEVSKRDFLLVLGNCPADQARRVAARLLKGLQADASLGPWFDLKFGIATLTEAGASLDQLVALADKALVQSKATEEQVVLNWQSLQIPPLGKGMAGAA